MSLKQIFKQSVTGKAEYPADFKCPKPEDALVQVPYAFTLNPLIQPNNLMRHADIVNFYDDLRAMAATLQGCKLTLVTELSLRGRVHFHGYLTITDKMLFYFHDLNQICMYGNIDLERLKDPLTWDLYIYKNRDMMSEWLTFINCSHLGYYEHNFHT